MPATSDTSFKVISFFLLWPLTVLMKQTRQVAMFVERKVRYSALFTNLVRWHAGAVSFPLSDIILAQLACPLSDVLFCLHSGRTNLSLYKHWQEVWTIKQSIHRHHIEKIDCLMARTASLACQFSTDSGHRNIKLWKTSASSRHKTKQAGWEGSQGCLIYLVLLCACY